MKSSPFTIVSSHVERSKSMRKDENQSKILIPTTCTPSQTSVTLFVRVCFSHGNGDCEADSDANSHGYGSLPVVVGGEESWVLERPVCCNNIQSTIAQTEKLSAICQSDELTSNYRELCPANDGIWLKV